jgi:hypothetical protein
MTRASLRSFGFATLVAGGTRDTINTRMSRIAIGAMMATTALVALGIPTAQAYTFTFNDMGLATNSTQWNTLFSPYIGPPGFSSSGVYDVVATTSGNPWTQGSPTNVASYVARTTSLREFIQNDPNFTGNPGGQFVIGADTLNMPTAWTTVGGAGTVANGIRNSNGTPGPIFFAGQTGAQTGFTFNQIVLSGTGTFDLQVRDTLNNVILPPMLITLSSTAQTIAVELLNANNIDFLSLSTGASIVVNSVEINDPIPAATPLPDALSLFVGGLGALGLLGWRRKKKATPTA